MTPAELTEIETEIASLQEKLKKLLPASDAQGSDAKNDLIRDYTQRLDLLQKQYAFGKETVGGDASSLQKVYDGSRLRGFKLPELEEQIEYAKSLLVLAAEDKFHQEWVISAPPEGMWSAIYQSLLAAKLLSESKTLISDTESVIMEVGRPYDLMGCQRFIKKLGERIGTPKNEAQRELQRMYTSLFENLYFAQWVAKCTADLLLEQPGNQPGDQGGKEDSSNAVQIEVEKSGDKFIARLDAFGGVGDTEIEALTNLFNAREQSRQAELFPEGGHAI